jgi:hypothetical protein
MEDTDLHSESSTEEMQGDLLEDSPPSDVSDEPERGTLEDAIREALQTEVIDEDAEPEEAQVAEEAESSAEVEKPVQEEVAELDSDQQLLKVLEDLKSSDVPLGKIDRFREVIEEKNGYKQRAESLMQVEEHFRTLQNSARASGMTEEQIAQYFELPMLMQSNPQAAYELIQGFQSDMANRYGMTMPEDIKQKVDDGYLDEETAQRLAKAEAESRMTKQMMEQRQAEAEEAAKMATAQAVSSAVNSYEQQLRNSDPDFDAKRGWLMEKLQVRKIASGLPESPEQAIEWVNQAYGEINETFKRMAPTPQPKRTLSSRGVNQPSSAPPASMYEAVLRAVGGSVTGD